MTVTLDVFFLQAVISGLVALAALYDRIPRSYAGAGIALMLTNAAVHFGIIPFPSPLFYVIIGLVGMWLLDELYRMKWRSERR